MVSRLEGRMVLNTKITSGDTRKPLRQQIEGSTMQLVQKNVHEAKLTLVNTCKGI